LPFWMRAQSKYAAGNASEAIMEIDNIAKEAPLRAHHWAFLGTLQIEVKDSEAAIKSFQMSLEMTNNKSNNWYRYVNLYSRIFLTVLRSDDSVKSMIIEACNLKCNKSLKKWLPLSHKLASTASARGLHLPGLQ
jgi:hypothetical protein